MKCNCENFFKNMQSLDYSVHRFLIFFFSSIFPYPGKQSDLCILLLNLNLSFKIMYLYSNLNNISKILYRFKYLSFDKSYLIYLLAFLLTILFDDAKKKSDRDCCESLFQFYFLRPFPVSRNMRNTWYPVTRGPRIRDYVINTGD